MASVYTTSRGKNKKAKLGMRKDAANNAANKLQTAIKSDVNSTEFLANSLYGGEIKSIGSEKMREKLKLKHDAKQAEKGLLTAPPTSDGTIATNTAANDKLAAELAAALVAASIKTSSSIPSPSTSTSTSSSVSTSSSPSVPTASGCAYSSCSSPANTKLSACSACRTVSYCGSSCQKADWSRHKVACKAAKAAAKASEAAIASPSTSDQIKELD